MSIRSKYHWFLLGMFLIGRIVFAEEKVNPQNTFQNTFPIPIVFEVEKFKGETRSFAELTNQAMNIIGTRLKALGVKAELRKESDKIIIINLKENISPGGRILNIIEEPYYLEFKLVENSPAILEKALSGNIPENYQLIYEWKKDAKGVLKPSTPYLVLAQPVLTGADIQYAQAQEGSPPGNDVQVHIPPQVTISLNPAGAKKFAEFTGANINRRLAIVLDGIVRSAPVIKEKVSSGRVQIAARFTNQEASDLALVLRTGSLPVRLKRIPSRN